MRHAVVVPDGVYVPGPLRDSVEVLGQVVSGVEKFLDAIGWSG